ncbi:pilus (MSHA type) biogenesis protein MshL [Methylotenera sp.]|uniref:pilus (MSHA type) biogenesis protein MshL n=1 Tax=Methylotenera sp. TaxID=2051956 RepID=UPI002733DA91|nr:pilus (MSHA type) biogenesis protein MshL [Methylotenera sp.]MDP3212079.1 pilus (MSHA type) biogenesis protein MshL [Methylotenera sp.]
MNNKTVLALLSMILVLCMTACSHQSKVQPSKGHIDGQNTSTPSVISKSAISSAAIPKPVTNSPYLPPPTPKAKEPVYSIVVYDTPVKEVLFAIARDSKLNVDIHPAIQGRVTINAVDQTLPAILERLSKQVDLTYNVKGNVLTITPDQPVLRSYKVDYVNINRDTTGFIGAAAEIAGIGQGASASAGSTQSTGGSGSRSSNSSRTAVTSEAKNHLWESLIQNIKDLLAETDKEVIVTRFGSLEGSEVKAADKKVDDKAAADAKELRKEQQSEYKTLLAANVIANPETGVISVRATNKQHEKVQEFIDKVMSSARKQVLIEATIVEVVLKDSFQTGIDWSRLGRSGTGSGFTFSQELNATRFNPGALTNRATSDNGGLVAGYFNPISPLGNIAASISLLQQFGDTKVLSSPKLMVLNNQTAVLKVVRNFVYFTIQSQISQATAAGGANLQATTSTPQTVPIGVVMSVTPQISEMSSVNLNVRPTISRLFGEGKADPTNEKNIIPEIEVREMESMLQIASGNTAVLGGLMQDEIQKNSDRVPGLSKVPGIGKAFTGRDDLNRKTELVIFLRPTVITSASLESDELASYKQYLPSQQLENTVDVENER